MRTSTADRPSGSIAPGRVVAGARVIAGLACIALVATAVVLLFADRAPGALEHLSERLDRSDRRAAQVASEVPIPHSAFAVHVAIWGSVTIAAGITAWSWRRLAVLAGALFAVSLAVEGAQELVTSSRGASVSDVAGNAVGISLGVAVVAACYLAAARWARAGSDGAAGPSDLHPRP